MEQKIYRLLGVNHYRRFVIKVKKLYDKWLGRQDTDNYFLKDYSNEGIIFLKNQLIKNAKIHLFGVLIGLFTMLAADYLWVQIAAFLIFLHNLYCVMIQRYNLIRINALLKKKNRTVKTQCKISFQQGRQGQIRRQLTMAKKQRKYDMEYEILAETVSTPENPQSHSPGIHFMLPYFIRPGR